MDALLGILFRRHNSGSSGGVNDGWVEGVYEYMLLAKQVRELFQQIMPLKPRRRMHDGNILRLEAA
jgi:hypothetical protein